MSRTSTPVSSSGNTAVHDESGDKHHVASDVEKQALDPAAQKPPQNDESELYKPKTWGFWLIILSNFIALFLVALDRTIIATAIPRITDEFHSLGDIGWYGSAYMLTNATFLLTFGRIYKHYEMKLAFLISIVIFEAGSAVCGAAPSSAAFIAGRLIAGAGAAGIWGGSMMIMIPMVPLHKRPMFQGIFGLVFGVASAVGPLIGGGFTNSTISWRWCFYINLPIGGAALIFMFFFWNPQPKKVEHVSAATHFKRLDPLGMLFYIPSTICLLLALQWGGSVYGWNDGRIIALFVIFGVLAIAFAAVQILMPENATMPPKVITQRSVILGVAYMFFLAGSMLMMFYYVPLWFQTVKLVDPVKSGVYTLPLVLSLVVSSILGGAMTGKLGYYVPAMLIAPALMGTAEGLMSTWNADSSQGQYIGYQFLAGFGLGFGMQTTGLAMQTVLPREDISTGISMMFFAQQIGGAIFTSVGQTILSNLLTSQLAGIPGIPASVVAAGATDLVTFVPPELMHVVVDAYNFACTRIFLSAMGIAFAALLAATGMEWRTIKKNKPGQGPPGAGPKPATPPEKAASSDVEADAVDAKAAAAEKK